MSKDTKENSVGMLPNTSVPTNNNTQFSNLPIDGNVEEPRGLDQLRGRGRGVRCLDPIR